MRRAFVALAVFALVHAVPVTAHAEHSEFQKQPDYPEVNASCGGGTPTADVPATFEVATWNVLHTLDGGLTDAALDGRMDAIATHLASAGADVIGLQEAEVVFSGDRAKNVPELLASKLSVLTGVPWRWCWFQASPHFPGEPDLDGRVGPLTEAMSQFARNGPQGGEFREGLGILSRFAIKEAKFWRQPSRATEAIACDGVDPLGCQAPTLFEGRGILRARIGQLDFYTTHISHELTDESATTKEIQIENALAHIDRTRGSDAYPDVFVGDFNSRDVGEGADRYEMIVNHGYIDTYRAAGYTDPGYTSGYTFDPPSGAPNERIDYIFAKPGSCRFAVRDTHTGLLGDTPEAVTVSPTETVTMWPSDHIGVVASVKLLKNC
jgi:endonuclease/exonuclease/phosphatase family metal-dependent hydrolase